MRVKSIFLAFVAVPATLAAQQPAVPDAGRAVIPTVTLQEAIDLGLRTHPLVVQGQATLNNAHSSQRVAVASWLPTLSLNSSVQKGPSTRYESTTGTIRQVTTPYAGSFGLNVNLVVFDGFARVFQFRQAGAQATSAEAGLVSQKFQVALQIKQAFFNALAAADRERVALTAVQRAQEQLKIAREKLLAGSAIRSDTLTATVSLGQSRLQVLNAQADRTTQEAMLARLIGFDRAVRALGDSQIVAVIDVDTSAIRAEALMSSPAIAAANAALRSAEATVNVARTAYFPTLSANYSNSRAGSAGGFGGALDVPSLNPTWNLSVGLSFPLFNGLRREQTVWNANNAREVSEANAADARRQVNASITQWLASLQAAQAQLSIARASREAADEALRVQRERYRLGAATIVDVLSTQLQLDQSEVDAITARVAYQIARAQLEALLGRPL